MKPQHKPLTAYRKISLASCFFLGGAALLLLLIGLSMPIVKAVYIIRVYATTIDRLPATSIATELRFGVWGFCAMSVLDERSIFTNNGDCYGPQLGYTIPETISVNIGLPDGVAEAVTGSLLGVLILHLVAAGTSLLTLISSLFLASRPMAILSTVLAIVSALLGTAMFVIDLVLVLTTKSQLPNFTNQGLAVAFGNAVWLALAAMVMIWIAVVLLSARACYCLGVRRKPADYHYHQHHKHHHHHHHEKHHKDEQESSPLTASV